jgi:hypothetical protein
VGAIVRLRERSDARGSGDWRILEAIDGDEALANDLEQLVGAEIMSELRAAQAAYGEALGITTKRATPVAIAVSDRLANARAAIVGHALQIVAMQDANAERIAAAVVALEPIDALRARQSRRLAGAGAKAGGAEGEASGEPGVEVDGSVTPTTPVPGVEDGDDGVEGQM